MRLVRDFLLYVGLAGALAFAVLFYGSPVAAQGGPICGDRDEFVAEAKKTFDEEVVAQATDQNGFLVEILASPKGSWTVLVTAPGGPTCVISYGENYSPISLPPNL